MITTKNHQLATTNYCNKIPIKVMLQKIAKQQFLLQVNLKQKSRIIPIKIINYYNNKKLFATNNKWLHKTFLMSRINLQQKPTAISTKI
jgi:hypothetical protein